AVLRLTRSAIEPDDFRSTQATRKADRQDRPIAQAAKIPIEGHEHRQKLIRKNRRLLRRRAGVPTADAGEHGGDVGGAGIEWGAQLAVTPGETREPPLERGERQ